MSLWIVNFDCLSQFNKVAGELVASHDTKNRPLMAKRIKKLVDEVGDLSPVSRLELNTEGLLLLTNNRILVRAQSTTCYSKSRNACITIVT